MKRIVYVCLMALVLFSGCHSVRSSDYNLQDVVHLPEEETSLLFSDLLKEIRSVVAIKDLDATKELEWWKSVNENVYALLDIAGLNIKEPVVAATESNKQWLRSNIYGEYDISGCIFLDYRCYSGNSPVILIHGHNMKDGTMFSDLPLLLNLENCSDAPIIRLYTTDGWLEYEVFSVISVNSEEEAFPIDQLDSESDIAEIQKDLLCRSLVPGGRINTNDLLVLNTCWYGNSGEERNLHCIVSASRI